MATVADENLEQFLTQCGLEWAIIPWKRHVVLNDEWGLLYGNPRHWLRQKQGAKAQYAYSQEVAEAFMVVPCLGKVAGVHSISKLGLRKAAYECHGAGTL